MVQKKFGRILQKTENPIQYLQNQRLCEKNSVNSTTVIKNDIVERLEKQPLNFFTVYNKYRNLSNFFNSQPVGVHDLQFAKNSAPVSQRHRPLLCNLVGCQIQSL